MTAPATLDPRAHVAAMYAVATDYEAETLDNLRHRARIVWTCEDPDRTWTNPVGERCEQCGRSEAQSVRKWGRITR